MVEDKCDDIRVGGWHLKKEVTIGQIITMATIIVSGLSWASSVETRLSESNVDRQRIEQKLDIVVKGMDDRFDRYQKTVSDALIDIKQGINRLSDKIDQKQDK